MSEDLLLQKAFPVLDGNAEQLYCKLEKNGFKDNIPQQKNLSYITTLATVHREELVEFQQKMEDALSKNFGYPNPLGQKNSNNAKIDKWIGKFLYDNMNITPSIAATLEMWQFMNLHMFPSVVYWRWGNAKHRYISSNRNYFGTAWWRHYFFTQYPDLEKEYFFVTEDEIVSLYERPKTRGLPEHIRNNILWYREFCKKYNVKDNEFYREVIKKYNAELGFRNYYALENEDLHKIYEEAFVSALGKEIDNNVVEKGEDTNIEDNIFELEEKEELDMQPLQDIANLVVKKDVKNTQTHKRYVVIKKDANKGVVVNQQLIEANGTPQKPQPYSNYIFVNNTVLISRNPNRNEIEIFFDSMPKEIIREQIKKAGFVYFPMERKWYAKETPERMKDLKRIFRF